MRHSSEQKWVRLGALESLFCHVKYSRAGAAHTAHIYEWSKKKWKTYIVLRSFYVTTGIDIN